MKACALHLLRAVRSTALPLLAVFTLFSFSQRCCSPLSTAACDEDPGRDWMGIAVLVLSKRLLWCPLHQKTEPPCILVFYLVAGIKYSGKSNFWEKGDNFISVSKAWPLGWGKSRGLKQLVTCVQLQDNNESLHHA